MHVFSGPGLLPGAGQQPNNAQNPSTSQPNTMGVPPNARASPGGYPNNDHFKRALDVLDIAPTPNGQGHAGQQGVPIGNMGNGPRPPIRVLAPGQVVQRPGMPQQPGQQPVRPGMPGPGQGPARLPSVGGPGGMPPSTSGAPLPGSDNTMSTASSSTASPGQVGAKICKKKLLMQVF